MQQNGRQLCNSVPLKTASHNGRSNVKTRPVHISYKFWNHPQRLGPRIVYRMSSDFVSIQDIIPGGISSKKCRTNTGPSLNGYELRIFGFRDDLNFVWNIAVIHSSLTTQNTIKDALPAQWVTHISVDT